MKKITRTAMLFAFVAAVLTACGGGGEKKDADDANKVEAAVETAKEEAKEAAKATEKTMEEAADKTEAKVEEAVEEVETKVEEATQPKAEKRGSAEGEKNVATKRGGETTESGKTENKASKR